MWMETAMFKWGSEYKRDISFSLENVMWIFKKLIFFAVLFLGTAVVSLGDGYERHIDRDLDISFVYPDDWIISKPIEEATKFVVRWETKKSKSLLATCYIRALRNKDWQLFAEDLPTYYKTLLESFIQKTRDRSDDLKVISEKLTRLDGKDVIFITLKTKVQNLNKVMNIRLFTVLTFWRKHEIALECGTELLEVDLNEFTESKREDIKEFQKIIEQKIMRVLSSLHFDRTG